MKILIYLPVFFILYLFSIKGMAQNSPEWTRDINALPDSTSVFPVRTLHDGSNNVLVLSTYYKSNGGQSKIYLKKFSETGTLLWSFIYDNGGIGQPRGFDMAIDNSGNCYIAGGFMESPNYKPLLLKINSNGGMVWLRDSSTVFNTGYYYQIIFKNNCIYLSGPGVASFDLNGNEKWSNNNIANRIAVDNKGQVITSGFDASNNNVFRYDSLGNLNFSDSSVYYATRITTDINNSFYLLTGSTQYELVKYDSSGSFQWSKTDFPATPPFGDIGLDVLIDYNNDIIVLGLADSMFKFSQSGTLIWAKSMYGLDGYYVVAEISFNNNIIIAGNYDNGNDNEVAVTSFNHFGNPNWSASYNGNAGTQEFAVDMTIDNSGVYVIENNNQNTTLIKFSPPHSAAINYSLLCVDSVWYSTDQNYINVRVFNGNTAHLNYPSVQIVSPSGDTISNPQNKVDFFAHIGNTFQTYYDTITISGINDFSNYRFLISKGFGDTTVLINMCGLTEINERTLIENEINIYPNPFNNDFTISSSIQLGKRPVFKLYDTSGREVIHKNFISQETFNRGDLLNGIYFYIIENEKGIIKTGKIVVE